MIMFNWLKLLVTRIPQQAARRSSARGLRTWTGWVASVAGPVSLEAESLEERITPTLSFTPAANFGVGTNPYWVAEGDFNGDGNADLVTANVISDNVSLLLGNGLGGFGAATNFAVGDGPKHVAVGDFNGDGKADVATANYFSHNLSVLLGDGLGGFGAATNFGAGPTPYFLIVEDFNGDGNADLATANSNSSDRLGDGVSVLLGNGLGGFGAATIFAAGAGPTSVISGDFNGDGNADLVATNFYSDNVSVLLGNGLGGFGAATNFAVVSPFSVTVGDFNGDGKADLATVHRYSNNVSVLLGNGLGSFSAAASFAAGNETWAVTVADFNGDGNADLATANLAGNVSVLLGNGLGAFGAATNFSVGSKSGSVTVGDFNEDGRADLATTNYDSNSVSVLLNLNTPTINDGTAADIDFQNSTTTLSSNWGGVFADLISGITGYEWAIGSASGATDVQGFTSVGTATSASNNSLTLISGQTYFVTVRATNGTGLQSVATSDGVTVDNTAPDFIAPSDITIEAMSAVGAVVFYAMPTANDDVDGSVAVTADTDHAPGSTFALGTTVVTLSAQDEAGNSVSHSFSITVVPDTTAPTVDVTLSPASPNGTNGWYITQVTVTPSASDAGMGIGSESVTLDGTPMSFGSFLVSSQGTHTVVVNATDGAGNSSSFTQTFQIDTVAPTVTITAPSDQSVINNNQPTLSATASDASSGLASVQFEYSSDGVNWLSVGDPQTGSGPFSVSFAVPLADGTYQVRAIATDNAGNRTTNDYSLSTLASFDHSNGETLHAGLVLDSSGNLFGTTYAGGANGYGTVFEIAQGSMAITTLASFDYSNGAYPSAGLVLDSSGNLFGTTEYGGANGSGTVFEIVQGSTAITTLASFDYSNGATSTAGLVLDSSGNLFGTTVYGGANGYGTVFEIAQGSTVITTLASFDYSNGAYSQAGLVLDSSGNLFGTTGAGGVYGYGTVFEIVQGSMAITTLASFDYSNGANPIAGLVLDSSGNLFGTTYQGGINDYGTVFEITQGSTVITTLASFDYSNGAYPYAGLVLDSSGNLFGTTVYGGIYGYGTAFKIVQGSTVITTLFSFDGSNGTYPFGGLILDSSGNLFGTTGSDRVNGAGTVFELSPPAPTTVTFTIKTNVAPTLTSVTSNHDECCNSSANGTVSVNGAFTDSGLDTHTVTVNWGDGTVGNVSVNQFNHTFLGSHHYATGGVFTVIVTVMDNHGASSESLTTQAVVQGVGLVDGTLYIIGTEGRDHINIHSKAATKNKPAELIVDAKFNQTDGNDGGSDGGSDGDSDSVKRSFNPAAIVRIVADLCGGDDDYNGGGPDGGSDGGGDVAIPQFVFGGAGKDHIQGGSGADVISGGAGDDVLMGRGGRDILIGGDGKDDLKGGDDNDLLVGGIVANEENLDSLKNALQAWISGDVTTALLQLSTIQEDGDKDDLSGEKGTDVLKGGSGDKLKQ